MATFVVLPVLVLILILTAMGAVVAVAMAVAVAVTAGDGALVSSLVHRWELKIGCKVHGASSVHVYFRLTL
jgi:hypothetical protein